MKNNWISTSFFLLFAGAFLWNCSVAPRPGFDRITGRTTQEGKPTKKGFTQKGSISYYGKKFHGRKTANGETFNMNDMTAAHRTLPFGTKVRVTLKSTGKTVMVRVNDRGPFKKNRILDLSYAAAKKIGLIAAGVGEAEIEVQ